MKKLLWWIVKRLALSQPKVKLIFTRNHDGAECEVTCCACKMCKNYYWVHRFEIEEPDFCPYCGIRFNGTVPIDPDEMDKIAMISDE